MLDLALATSFAVLATTTLLLLTNGQRPLPGLGWRLVVAELVGFEALIGWLLGRSIAPLEVGAAIVVIACLFPGRWYAIGAMFFASLLSTTVLYAIYLAQATVLLTNGLISLTLGLVLLGIEYGAMVLIIGTAFEMIDSICSLPTRPPAPPPLKRWPVVCLQVPTYNEPPELVIETIHSLIALDYPALRVQVIDNNTSDESLWRPVADECEDLRRQGYWVEFTHLPKWPGYKAGALNWGRDHFPPEVEILGIIDADYVVRPDWLRKLVPYFGDPKVAFVQSPQDYRAWEGSAFYRACYVGLAYFFKVGMVSRDHSNAIIFAGTMGLLRRSVLDEVGGWDEEIITEDAEISLRILARGYRGVYVPDAYGRGIMPLTYEGLRKQRYRWAFGGVQILRRHWRLMLDPFSGLSLGQRYCYLMGSLWWFNDALTLGFTAFIAATGVGALIGRGFVVQRLTGMGVVLPTAFILLALIRYLWALRATTSSSTVLSMAALRVNFSLSWVITLACVRAIAGEKGVFLRTPKFAGIAAVRELRMVWVEALMGVGGTVLLVIVLYRIGFALIGLLVSSLLVWSLIIYGSALIYALGDPERAPLEATLRRKMALEVSSPVGRAVSGAPSRIAMVLGILAALAIGAGVLSESGRQPVAQLPFRQPAQHVSGATASPAASLPAAATPAPVKTPAAATPAPVVTPAPATNAPVVPPAP